MRLDGIMVDGDGLVGKYIVRKNDSRRERVHPCFVLRYDRDPHARVALRAYADSVEGDNPKLAMHLRDALMRWEKAA